MRWSAARSPSASFRACRRSSPIASSRVEDPLSAPALAFALLEGDEAATAEALRKLAERAGPIVRLQTLSSASLAAGEDYTLADLVEECATATNTAAAGGNASLMTIG